MPASQEAPNWEIGEKPSISPDARDLPTVPRQFARRSVESERFIRRVFTVAVIVLLALGLAGIFGVRTTTATASAGGYELEVSYPRVTRPGLASVFDIHVSTDDGSPLAAPVTVAVSRDYLRLYDQNTIDPLPASETATEDAVVWDFDPPPEGSTLGIQLDLSVEPGVQWGRDGFVRILDQDRTIVESTFHTWVTP